MAATTSFDVQIPLMKLIQTDLFKKDGTDSVDMNILLCHYGIKNTTSGQYHGGSLGIGIKVENQLCTINFSSYSETFFHNYGSPKVEIRSNGMKSLQFSGPGSATYAVGTLALYCNDSGCFELHVDWVREHGWSLLLRDARCPAKTVRGCPVPVFQLEDYMQLPPLSFMGHFEGAPFEDDNYTDYHIKAEDRTFHTHISVLKRTVGAWDAMFAHPSVVENKTGDYVIEDFSAEAVGAFLHVLYDPATITDYIRDMRVLMDIYKLADKYQAKRVFELSAKALSYSKIDQDSICEAIIFAKDRKLDELYKGCVTAASYIPKEFWESDTFVSFMEKNGKIGCGFYKDVAFP